MDIKNYNAIFSNNLLYMLSKNKKKQIDLSKDLKIPKSTVSSWCCGRRIPKFKTLAIIADYLNIDNPIILLDENLKNFI